jgi:tetratricopeptide (TPR) repeat protein
MTIRGRHLCQIPVVLVVVLGTACWPQPTHATAAVASSDASVLQDPPGVKESLEQADAALKRGEYDEALVLYSRANSRAGNRSADALWGMALAYQGLDAEKNVRETLDKFLLLVADDPKRQAAAYNLKGQAAFSRARLNSDRRKLAEAEAHVKRAIELQPDDAVFHYNLGMVLLSRKDDAAGIEQMRRCLELDPDGANSASARQMIDHPRRARENPAPPISGTSLNGERVSIEDLRIKVVVLDFWATWCGPCTEALPGLKRLVKFMTGGDVVIVSISGDKDVQKWRAAVAKDEMTWPQLLDASGQVQRAYGVYGIPTYIVVDHEGIIRERLVGYGPGTDSILYGAVSKWLKAARAAATKKQ